MKKLKNYYNKLMEKLKTKLNNKTLKGQIIITLILKIEAKAIIIIIITLKIKLNKFSILIVTIAML